MRTLTTLSLLATLLLSVPSFAAETPTTATATEPTATAIALLGNTFEAQVVSVNLKRRIVNLRNAQGDDVQVMVGDQARNLEQLHAGDQVTARTTETVVMQLKAEKSEPKTTIERIVGRAPEGMKPGAVFERDVQFIADVTAVDAESGIISLKGVADHVAILSVNNPSKLQGIQAGDQVEGVLAQSLEILVLPEAPTKHAAHK